ncbi:heme/hemin ABC transporter substrate-binding protein [Pseudochelatococcus sp.]|jgi:iron complex transport system substrate-binding protein|uniref:heme/hemin ABC transporter substrate-binding protein n=1 Tax=Pseudochelatococcus sp. TaxID=2020869 RepID=UPI003D8DEC2F
MRTTFRSLLEKFHIATVACCLLAAIFLFVAGSREGRADDAAPRIVSVGGAITEILYDLGLADRIAGVDTTSRFPPEALSDKPNVGYMRALSAEGVLALAPTQVLLLDGSGPPGALQLLAESGLPVVRIGDDPTPAGVAAKIREIGRATGATAGAAALAASVERRFALLEALRGKIDRPKKVLFVLGFQGGRPLVAGQETAADGIIRLAGAQNAAQGFSGYKPMTDEAIITAAPEAIVTMGGAGHATDADDLFARPAFAGTPAAAQKRFISRDGQFLLGFGPRTPQAAADLLHALYPDVPVPDELAAGAR